MHHDQGLGTQFQGAFHHFSGIDRGMIHRAGLLPFSGDHRISTIEEQDMELLDSGEGDAGAAVVEQGLPGGDHIPLHGLRQ